MKKISIYILLFFLSFNINAGQKKIETIIANGIGTSIQDAAQNAAENALTQAVGSFIDATTMLEKRTVIEDGIVSRSKVINKDIKEYSQGSIQYFEILDAKQTSGIFRVAARVDVRIEDFRAYIKKLGADSQVISSGLFTQMKTDQDNAEDRMSLIIDKILMPIMAGEVHNIELQRPIPFSQFRTICESLRDRKNGYQGYGFEQECPLPRDWNPSEVVVVQFTISLKDEFVDNMTNIFENISNSKQQSHLDKVWKRNDVGSPYENYNKFMIINNKNNNYSAKIYILDNYETDMKFYLKKNFSERYRKDGFTLHDDFEPEYGFLASYGKCHFSADLNFDILDDYEEAIFNKVIPTCGHPDKWEGLRPIDSISLAGLGPSYLSLYNRYNGMKNIISQRKYYLYVQLSPNVLQKAKTMEMFFTKN